MSAQVTTVLWDLDGTLVDSQADIFDCLCRSVEAVGLPVDRIRKLLRIGPTIDVLVRQAYPEIDGPRMEAVIAGFRKSYDYSDFPNTIPYRGIDRVVRSLGSRTQFIITNKPCLPSTRMIKKLEWDHVFKDIYTPDKTGVPRKSSKPDLFSQVIREHHLDVQECLAVGDTVADIEAARSTGVLAIGVSWGYNSYDELLKAKAASVVVSVEELFALLTNNQAPTHVGVKAFS